MTTHMVTGTVVKVSVGSASGNRIARILRHGDIVPEGVDDELLARLADRGLISELPSDEELLAEALAEREAEAAAVQAEFDARVAEAAERIVTERTQAVVDAAVVDAAIAEERDRVAAAAAADNPPAADPAATPASAKSTARGAGAKQ
ncbi:hypothetical protein [Clavibacter michiganensis]|uniref:hypothetical protein n=1 Tax=Clavibacter michiganensis TaxID=28447 RepID=UPI001C64E9A9|nr:hypothetical protein [Clavibacter michiganensis]